MYEREAPTVMPTLLADCLMGILQKMIEAGQIPEPKKKPRKRTN